jgi:hypothetical protein
MNIYEITVECGDGCKCVKATTARNDVEAVENISVFYPNGFKVLKMEVIGQTRSSIQRFGY